MKTCIFINGTNCVGKSTLAKELIARFGGIGSVSRTLTSCKNGLVCFAGRYDLTKRYGGVDGFNSTKVLADVVLEGLQAHEVIVCEGSYFHTIGLNLTNAMFEAEQHLVVYLYAPVDTLNARLLERGGMCSSLLHWFCSWQRVRGNTLKLPTLAKHQSNHVHELFYDRRSW